MIMDLSVVYITIEPYRPIRITLRIGISHIPVVTAYPHV